MEENLGKGVAWASGVQLGVRILIRHQMTKWDTFETPDRP